MGSGGSKGSCKGGASSSRRSIFHCSCLRSPSGSAESRNKNFANRNLRQPESEPDQVKREPSSKVKGQVAPGYEMPLPCISSGGGSSSGRATSEAPMHHSPSRCLSGFSFFPGNVSFRLSRANSLGSSRAYPTSPAILNPDDSSDTFEQHPQQLPQNSSSSMSLYSPVIFNDGNTDTDRRVVVGSREPVETNVRFSRTLSVGRLRDRVLRRASLSEFTFCPQNINQTHAFAAETRSRESATSPSSSTSTATVIANNPVFNIQDREVETSRSREARYHDLLEHRSNFLERRRRIRSQVRALQRLGSRFENFSGHERSCILSGQHRTGRCTCRVNNQDSNSNDETSARASISRIVMLAEALFEVLDEIHQQSVVLSSQPSVSSIGSVPAPNEVVDSLPVKAYNKSHNLSNDEAGQCYICLVEYEEGDSMRILPCNHEFHRTCIDKWLKEIHRVCPLCRGDICRHDLLAVEN